MNDKGLAAEAHGHSGLAIVEDRLSDHRHQNQRAAEQRLPRRLLGELQEHPEGHEHRFGLREHGHRDRRDLAARRVEHRCADGYEDAPVKEGQCNIASAWHQRVPRTHGDGRANHDHHEGVSRHDRIPVPHTISPKTQRVQSKTERCTHRRDVAPHVSSAAIGDDHDGETNHAQSDCRKRDPTHSLAEKDPPEDRRNQRTHRREKCRVGGRGVLDGIHEADRRNEQRTAPGEHQPAFTKCPDQR